LAITNLQRKFDKLLFFYLFIWVGNFRNLLYVTAQTKKEGGKELFYFNKADIYTEPSFERFISLLTDGKIMYDIRIGSYKSGPKYGMPHDHGSGFRILEANIRLLYSDHETIE
ncbi:MvaI/BcnI family restriction endonuclease, partial [Parabacteroides distasonis]|uniref:MvaI/BcnI family restriction endonuclease n=1 Tax=Parabacteroides distasonis TaxID=823 RepID=UPI0039B6B95B